MVHTYSVFLASSKAMLLVPVVWKVQEETEAIVKRLP